MPEEIVNDVATKSMENQIVEEAAEADTSSGVNLVGTIVGLVTAFVVIPFAASASAVAGMEWASSLDFKEMRAKREARKEARQAKREARKAKRSAKKFVVIENEAETTTE